MPPPPPINLPHPGLCIAAHHSSSTLAIGLATGGVVVASVSEPLPVFPVTHPVDNPCRTTCFIPNTPHFLTSTSSAHVLLFDTTRRQPLHSATLATQRDTGDEPASATAFTPLDTNIVAMGDDNGGLHLLDLRTSCSPVVSILEQADYISAIANTEAFGTSAFLASSGDGSLCAYDIRVPPHSRLRLQYAHDSFNDDLLSMAVLHKSSLVVAGTMSGAINLYNMRFMDKECDAEAAAHVDRFFGHPECVNAIIPFEDSGVILTASTDGIVRVVDAVSKSLVGVLEYDQGDGGERVQGEMPANGSAQKRKKNQSEAWPVEDMVSIAGLEKPAFALLGHDEVIRFCDGSVLVDEDEEDPSTPNEKTKALPRQSEVQEKTAEEFAAVQSSQRRKKKKKRKSVADSEKRASSSGFFDDL